jgi:hypothetical protein
VLLNLAVQRTDMGMRFYFGAFSLQYVNEVFFLLISIRLSVILLIHEEKCEEKETEG